MVASSTAKDLLTSDAFLSSALGIGAGGSFSNAVRSATKDIIWPLLTLRLQDFSPSRFAQALAEMLVVVVCTYHTLRLTQKALLGMTGFQQAAAATVRPLLRPGDTAQGVADIARSVVIGAKDIVTRAAVTPAQERQMIEDSETDDDEMTDAEGDDSDA